MNALRQRNTRVLVGSTRARAADTMRVAAFHQSRKRLPWPKRDLLQTNSCTNKATEVTSALSRGPTGESIPLGFPPVTTRRDAVKLDAKHGQIARVSGFVLQVSVRSKTGCHAERKAQHKPCAWVSSKSMSLGRSLIQLRSSSHLLVRLLRFQYPFCLVDITGFQLATRLVQRSS